MGKFTYSASVAAEVCERLAKGESLRRICQDDHMPDRATVVNWFIHNVSGFAQPYTRARETGLDELADQTLAITDDAENDWETRENERGHEYVALNRDAVARSKLRADNRWRYLEKMAPKKYGVKTTTELTGVDGAPLFAEDERARRLAALRQSIAQRKEPTDASDLA